MSAKCSRDSLTKFYMIYASFTHTYIDDVHKFLGLVNFYHQFLPYCTDTLKPLHTLLTTAHKPKINLQWNERSLQAFSIIKQTIANISLLSHPHANAPTNIMTDASDMAVGAVL